MTAIIGLKDGDKISIIADGVSLRGWEATPITSPSNYKIQKINGSENCFVASSGTCAALNIVSKIPNLLGGKDEITFEEMVLEVVPLIFKSLDERGMLEERDGAHYAPGSFLITTKTKMFLVVSTGLVFEKSRVAFLGCGETELHARYMSMLDKEMDDVSRGVDAMKYAIKYNKNIMYPICVASNTNGDIKQFQKGEI